MSRPVALLAEGVDRNPDEILDYSDDFDVALLAEGVDRNSIVDEPQCDDMVSPSSRRAWIEM